MDFYYSVYKNTCNRKRLRVVFLDLAKAFDTVSHEHISEGLKRFRVDSHFIDAVVDLYTDASTHFTLAKGETPKIPMTRGVKQGDPLSPLLFNVAMDPLLEAISVQNNDYKWDESGLKLNLFRPSLICLWETISNAFVRSRNTTLSLFSIALGGFLYAL
jgi:retron-type reverse transcriptase